MLSQCCCNVDAGMQQHCCGNAAMLEHLPLRRSLPDCKLPRCNQKSPCRTEGASLLKSRKVQVRKKTRKIVCALLFFLAFFLVNISGTRAPHARVRSYCDRKCNTISRSLAIPLEMNKESEVSFAFHLYDVAPRYRRNSTKIYSI